MKSHKSLAALAAAVGLSLVTVGEASAACTRLAFSVNDYGKDGPTRDAKNLLDKYIAKWTADRKIKGHTVGPKAVSCELFIDLIVFDEFTCKAEATVCWNGPLPPGHKSDGSATGPTLNKAASKAPAKSTSPVPASAAKPAARAPAAISTGSVKPAPAKAAPPAAAPAVAAPARVPAAAPTPVAAPPAPASAAPVAAPAAN